MVAGMPSFFKSDHGRDMQSTLLFGLLSRLGRRDALVFSFPH